MGLIANKTKYKYRDTSKYNVHKNVFKFVNPGIFILKIDWIFAYI